MKKDNLYYTTKNIDDYNKSFNFLTGARKTGKAKYFERLLDKDDITREVTRENELRMLDLNTQIWKKYMHYSNILNESLKYEPYLNDEELSKEEADWAADSLISSFEDFMYTEDFVFWCEHYNCYQYKKPTTSACDKYCELKEFEINNMANQVLQKTSEVENA